MCRGRADRLLVQIIATTSPVCWWWGRLFFTEISSPISTCMKLMVRQQAGREGKHQPAKIARKLGDRSMDDSGSGWSEIGSNEWVWRHYSWRQDHFSFEDLESELTELTTGGWLPSSHNNSRLPQRNCFKWSLWLWVDFQTFGPLVLYLQSTRLFWKVRRDFLSSLKKGQYYGRQKM